MYGAKRSQRSYTLLCRRLVDIANLESLGVVRQLFDFRCSHRHADEHHIAPAVVVVDCEIEGRPCHRRRDDVLSFGRLFMEQVDKGT